MTGPDKSAGEEGSVASSAATPPNSVSNGGQPVSSPSTATAGIAGAVSGSKKIDPGGADGRATSSWLQGLAVAGGFIAGIVTALSQLVTPWVTRDVRNQVYEATFQEKQRVISTQDQLLRLQEDYIKRLQDLKAAQDRIDAEEVQSLATKKDLESKIETAHANVTALKQYYRRLDQDEQDREAAKERADQSKKEEAARADAARRHESEIQKKIAPWLVYTCAWRSVPADGQCDSQWVFGLGTADEHLVTSHHVRCPSAAAEQFAS